MSDTFKYVQNQTSFLAGSGAIATATTITLSSFTQIDGSTTLTMTDFGSIGFGTLEPNNSTQEEQICFTGITQNANGTATLTGVCTVLTVAPYTQTSGLSKSHPGGAKFVISNTAGFYDKLLSKADDETITGKFIFPSDDVSNAGIVADTDTAVATAFVTLGQLSRQAISGASNASTTVKGIVELPTQAQMDAKTTTGETGALLAVTPDVVRSTLLSDYVADTGTATAFAIAPSPAITAYATGQRFVFKASHANAGTSTLAVNGLSAQKLRAGKAELRSQYIRTNWCVGVIYDGSGFEIESASAQVPVSQDGAEIYGTSVTGTTAYVVGLVPIVSKYTAGMVVNFMPDVIGGHATLNVNSLGAKNILINGVAVTNSDIPANQVASVIYNGTAFELVNSKAIAKKVATSVANTSFASSTAENTLVSESLPAFALGTSNAVKITIQVTQLAITSGQSCTLRMRYGGSAVATVVITAGGVVDAIGRIECLLLGAGATNSQEGSLFVVASTADTRVSAVSSIAYSQAGTSAIDSTSAQTLTVTAQFSNSGASDAIQTAHYLIEVIR